jgi:hypothetical protein
LLNRDTLKSAIQASLESQPPTAAGAAQGWANAIAAHVAEGQSLQAVHPLGPSIDAGKPGLTSSIASAFQSGSVAAAASGLSAAVVTFYQGLLFMGVTAGAVTGVPGAGAMTASLSAAFSDNAANSATVAQAASSFADAIHACAQTVIVAHVAPAAVTGPLI